MKRLTYKDKDNYYSTTIRDRPKDPLFPLQVEDLDNAWQLERNKLGEIEDLMEEFGLDNIDVLRTLLKYVDRAKVQYQEQDLILAKYRAIEEELGIDLVKLIKCIRNEKGIWKKDFDGGLINTRCMLACYFGRWQIYDKENIYDLKDYGKTWALTKEELE